ncbi:hypothetical protein PsorP6_005275 [Peronosclerospora sorghi]|uniref:Uncharacterized protein n=1 Tax=Peronosclerospora sorghi TaxID=230839 RepID=A0ACC0W3P0_9STRA|nr:hypothetical protein PsorP6_005275 [Peronosclerospora sorghi]
MECAGWAQSSEKTIEELSTIGVFRSGGGQNPITAALVHSVLEQNLLIPHIDHLKSVFRARKAAMCAALLKYCPDVTFTEPSGGYFVWLRLPDGIHADLLLKEATTRHGVAFTPATRCSLYSGCDNDMRTSSRLLQWVRFSFAFYSEDEIRIGIERFQKALTSLK